MDNLTRGQRFRLNNPESYRKTRDKFNAKRRLKRRAVTLYLNEVKLSKGCELCGYNKHPGALQFDHIDRSKKYMNVSSINKDHYDNLDIIKEEVSKCRVLCANCHAEKTCDNKEWIKNE
jgi:site-specific DNA-adenine methylase